MRRALPAPMLGEDAAGRASAACRLRGRPPRVAAASGDRRGGRRAWAWRRRRRLPRVAAADGGAAALRPGREVARIAGMDRHRLRERLIRCDRGSPAGLSDPWGDASLPAALRDSGAALAPRRVPVAAISCRPPGSPRCRRQAPRPPCRSTTPSGTARGTRACRRPSRAAPAQAGGRHHGRRRPRGAKTPPSPIRRPARPSGTPSGSPALPTSCLGGRPA